MLLFISYRKIDPKLRNCKVFNLAQKNGRKCKTLFASGTENKDEELEGKNLLLDPWYVLVHGMGPYKVGQTK